VAGQQRNGQSLSRGKGKWSRKETGSPGARPTSYRKGTGRGVDGQGNLLQKEEIITGVIRTKKGKPITTSSRPWRGRERQRKRRTGPSSGKVKVKESSGAQSHTASGGKGVVQEKGMGGIRIDRPSLPVYWQGVGRNRQTGSHEEREKGLGMGLISRVWCQRNRPRAVIGGSRLGKGGACAQQ